MTMPNPRPVRHRGVAAAAMAALALLVLASPASAHVTVNADDSGKGAADAVLTFRVPNEEDSATTNKVSVTFPTDDPLASVMPEPKPGWTITTKKITFAKPIQTDDGTLTEGVGEITWTATGAGIPVGDFDSFRVLVGPLPDNASELAFPTVQTYSNGKTVAWADPTPANGPEPESPAPVLALTTPMDMSATTTTAAPTTTATTVKVTEAAVTPTTVAPSSSSGGGSNALSVIALVVGALGALLGGAAFAASRRRPVAV